MRTRSEHLAWWHSDSEVLPTAHPSKPWSKRGAQAPALVDDGVDIADAIGEELVYYRQIDPADTRTTGPRPLDSVDFQVRFRGISEAAGWASGASPQGLYIDDGYKKLGIGIGSSLDVIDPDTGNIIETISDSWPWLTPKVYLLRKIGSERWELWVEGKRLAAIGYERAASSTTRPAEAGCGSLDAAGTSEGVFDQFELGLNQAVPPQWKVDRLVNSMPPAIRARWTEEARALSRTGLGIISTVTTALDNLWQSMTASRVVDVEYDFDGSVLPSAANPPWTLTNPAAFGVVRERVRLNSNGAIHTRARMTVPAPTVPYPTSAMWSLQGKVILRSTVPDANGRTGPYLQVRNGARSVTAEMVELPVGSGVFYWVLTTGALFGALGMLETYPWCVGSYEEHDIELIVGEDVVLLLIDGQIVSRCSSAFFPASASTDFSAGSFGPAGAAASFDLERFHAEVRTYDVRHRPLQLQNAVERLIFVSGCETNDEIQTWTEHHFGVEALRGTTVGIVMEMRRVAGCSRTELVEEQRYAGWFLELSWPEVTPIYLELDGFFLDIYVEFAHRARNFTAQRLADLAARYLVPMSVVELTYHICVAEWMTGATAVVGGRTRITVPTTAQFAAGDAVTIHNAANTVIESSTVFQIVGATQLDVDLLTSAYAIGDTIRKELATT